MQQRQLNVINTDDYRLCFIIPCYNHGVTIGNVLKRLNATSYPCFVVDDGSDKSTKEELELLAQQFHQVHILTLPTNQGKGAAVIAGMRAAYEKKFTHVLQVDADEQHDLNDIAKFIELSQNQPRCLISGQPIYDRSIPKSRLYGRYITHFWVTLETLSRSLKDSMCGFRIYPLKETIQLVNSVPIGRRMDFDTDIMVKLYWTGIDSLFIPTKVIYPNNGISHFNILKDNLRISWMHTKLCFSMLRHLPYLLRKRKNND
ncbi:glycosyltransferase family 2 protein [Orbaceae bacterium ESL0721]|nr:glycosyltransferase family 2 protein [Orbaceae bacterium ESL0721]